MVIIRDLAGNIIGKEASAHYTPTRKLRNAREQQLCDKAANHRRVQADLEPVHDDAGQRCTCEDAPCCHHYA